MSVDIDDRDVDSPAGTTYHYSVLERATGRPTSPEHVEPDMESVDYKRQPDTHALRGAVESAGGLVCGIIRGGMFGLKTNQVAVLSAWTDINNGHRCFHVLGAEQDLEIRDERDLVATVRPTERDTLTRPGIYVIRWLHMRPQDIAEYTSLCLETWPRFEASGTQRCYGVFRPVESQEPCTLLMLTWYRDLAAWEQSRQLDPSDEHKWVRRSQMELSHWAQAGRLAE